MKCQTKHCRSKAYKAEKLCLSCRQRRFKERNPFMYHFNALRGNARRRGKPFTLTFDHFKIFAIENGLLDAHGNKAKNMSVDRIDPDRGYHIDNIQVLTISENVRKKYVDYYRSRMEHMDEEEIQRWQEYEDKLNSDICCRIDSVSDQSTQYDRPFS